MVDEDILIVTHGRCRTCGRLTAPVSVSNDNFESAIHRMMELAADGGWLVILDDADKIKLKCPVCAREAAAVRSGLSPPTVTMVTEFD